MGLVKTGWRLAEDGSPYRAGVEVLPMWKCCQFQCCQFPIGDGAGKIGLVYYSAKGKLTLQQNADIAVRQATDTDARTVVTFCRIACKQGVTKRKDLLPCHLRA